MNDIFKGFEQLLELAKTLEEKVDKGDIKTEFTVRSLSSIPVKAIFLAIITARHRR